MKAGDIEMLRELLEVARGNISPFGGPFQAEDARREIFAALPALLQLARAVQDAARIEVSREDWIDHCDAFGADLIGQTVALVPVPVKEG